MRVRCPDVDVLQEIERLANATNIIVPRLAVVHTHDVRQRVPVQAVRVRGVFGDACPGRNDPYIE